MTETSPSTQSTGHYSVVQLPEHWYVLCLSRELEDRPISRTLMGRPLVLFRDGNGRAAVLLDRCPHRNAPLSLGRMENGNLECSYHGWQFAADGQCQVVPGLCSEDRGRAQRATHFAVREQQGLVWVYGTPEVKPESEPFELTTLGVQGYLNVHEVVEAKASLHAVIENALDVPHTAFLHRGLFRGNSPRNRITAKVTRTANQVQAEYIGEPRPAGVVGWLLAPGGGTVIHYDRFLLPSIAQVEYHLGEANHILVTAFCTPVSDFLTRIHAVVSLKLRVPAWLLRPILTPVALGIFAQDERILEAQTESITRFGGERFASTEVDLLGQQIWRLLRRAELGQAADEMMEEEADSWSREITLEV
jgi:phenylpropionate dioxygenase-like ring-hydroxylating dioxygenase large terminal subunit